MWKKTEDGILISLKVIPNASKNEIVGWEKDELKVKVTASPEKGNANASLITYLSKVLKIAKNRITLVSGSTSQHKRILISGINEEFLIEKGFSFATDNKQH